MKVSEIKVGIFPEGKNAGMPCLIVPFTKGKKAVVMDLDKVVTKILKFDKIKRILIYGNLSEEPEIKPLIAGLVSQGKHIVFSTSAVDDIGPVRSLPRISFILSTKPPTEKGNTLRITNLALLKEDDELRLIVDNMQDYKDAKVFLGSRNLVLPTVLFSINKVSDVEEMVEAYLKDFEMFKFDSKLSKDILL